MIKTITFDFGNVIGFFDHHRASKRLAAYTDLPPADVHACLFGNALEDDYESGWISTAEFVHRVRDHCRLRCSDEQFQADYADIFWPNPDVCDLIPRLAARYRLLVLSNTNELHTRRFRGQFADTLRHFAGLVLSHEVGTRKPRAEIFQHAQRLAGCAPEECVFIDDLPANVAGARAVGWHGIVYTTSTDLLEQLAVRGTVF
jgi:HAD superfamily hydrolase (TIGR01509 family)